jgi:hypothetical protein
MSSVVVPWRCERCNREFNQEHGGICGSCGKAICQACFEPNWKTMMAAGKRGPRCGVCAGGATQRGQGDGPTRGLLPSLGVMNVNIDESAYVYFRVASEHLPLEEISSSLGIEPTECWRKGDVGIYNPSRPDSGWLLYSPLPRSNLRIDEHIEALLRMLEAYTPMVREFGQRYTTSLVCVGHFSESSPGFSLSKQLVERIAKLALSLDFDLYFDCGQWHDA